MKYYTFKNYGDILKIGKYWTDRCHDDTLPDGRIFHHLPLYDDTKDPTDFKNIFINDSYRKEFTKDMKLLEKYIKQVESVDKKAFTLNSEIMDMRQILPPWIVYPYYPADKLILTNYFSIFKDFVGRMTKMELSAYKKLYPVPDYMNSVFKYRDTEYSYV